MRRTAVLAVMLAAAGAFGVGLVLHPLPPRTVGPSELQQVRAELQSRYYRRLPTSVLAKRSIPAVLAALHDRYTAYLTPAEYRVARRAFAGGYGGVGITVLPAPGGLLVRRTSVGSVHVEGVRPGRHDPRRRRRLDGTADVPRGGRAHPRGAGHDGAGCASAAASTRSTSG